MTDCYYVLAKIVASGKTIKRTDRTVGLAIMAHPIQWALSLNYTPNATTKFKVTPLFYEKISSEVYEAATRHADVLIIDGLAIGLQV
jgi:hypothetical protein